jgi:hypothetical protein
MRSGRRAETLRTAEELDLRRFVDNMRSAAELGACPFSKSGKRRPARPLAQMLSKIMENRFLSRQPPAEAAHPDLSFTSSINGFKRQPKKGVANSRSEFGFVLSICLQRAGV